MKFKIVVARNFPGYKTIEIEADDELQALRVLEERVAQRDLLVDDGTAFDPQWDLGDGDRVVEMRRPDGTVVDVAPGALVFPLRKSGASRTSRAVSPSPKYLELVVPAAFDERRRSSRILTAVVQLSRRG